MDDIRTELFRHLDILKPFTFIIDNESRRGNPYWTMQIVESLRSSPVPVPVSATKAPVKSLDKTAPQALYCLVIPCKIPQDHWKSL
jgi:hypothetical protein